MTQTAPRTLALVVLAFGLLSPLSSAVAQSITGTDPVPHGTVVTAPAPAPSTSGQTSASTLTDIVLSWLGLS